MSLFFCGVVFSFPRLRYKNPSTCSIIFRLPLLEKISPNRLVCVFFWIAVIAKLQEEESRFFLLPEGLFFIARHQIEPFLHIYCKIFCRRFVFVLCTKGFCFNHEYPGFFYILAGTNHICRAYIADFFYQEHLFWVFEYCFQLFCGLYIFEFAFSAFRNNSRAKHCFSVTQNVPRPSCKILNFLVCWLERTFWIVLRIFLFLPTAFPLQYVLHFPCFYAAQLPGFPLFRVTFSSVWELPSFSLSSRMSSRRGVLFLVDCVEGSRCADFSGISTSSQLSFSTSTACPFFFHHSHSTCSVGGRSVFGSGAPDWAGKVFFSLPRSLACLCCSNSALRTLLRQGFRNLQKFG